MPRIPVKTNEIFTLENLDPALVEAGSSESLFKIMKKTFMNWLIMSSSDPRKYALTVYGILLSYVGIIAGLAQTFSVPLSDVVVVKYITAVCFVFGVILTIIGLARKLWFLIKGDVTIK